jgi:IMP dehydrogenase
MVEKIPAEGFTFDDVLLIPGHSSVVPTEANTATRLTKSIQLNIPIVSSAMDTVTTAPLAIALAQEGGMGFIHKNLTIETQANEVTKVKRFEAGIITDPICLPAGKTVAEARQVMEEKNISGIPITEGKKLLGIITSRDLRFQSDETSLLEEVMTQTPLVTGPEGTNLDQAKTLLIQNKVEKLLIVDGTGNLTGLITMKDINKKSIHPHACKDDRGRLRVGAAIGVHEYERAEALVKAETDVLVVDTAHGHSKNVIETVRELRKRFPDQAIIAGNIATKEAAEDLIAAGVDGLKVGIGPGSICTTRIVAGVGVPQISAIIAVNEAAHSAGIPIIADGGIRHSGDIPKAISAGAHTVMIGSLFAGVEESPGEMIIHKGRSYKAYRGMGSEGAMIQGSKDRYGQSSIRDAAKLVPEGVEGMVPFKGPIANFVYQLVGGLRAGMGYCGCATVEELREKSRFLRVSTASLRESHPHDIVIIKESPNYSAESPSS